MKWHPKHIQRANTQKKMIIIQCFMSCVETNTQILKLWNNIPLSQYTEYQYKIIITVFLMFVLCWLRLALCHLPFITAQRKCVLAILLRKQCKLFLWFYCMWGDTMSCSYFQTSFWLSSEEQIIAASRINC